VTAPAHHEDRFGVRDGRGTESTLALALLGGFRLDRDGEILSLSLVDQRLVAFLALHNRPLQRTFVAGNLWIDNGEERASGNLRTALWRLRHVDERLIHASRNHLRLSAEVTVDLHAASARAHDVLRAGGMSAGDEDAIRLAGDLLPDWYDDWVLIERERFRQLRLHALEALSAEFLAAGAHGLALEAGLACVAADPLRESAHRALIRVHLAEGNAAEAVRQYELYRRLLARELGLRPSGELEQMMEHLRAAEEPARQPGRRGARPAAGDASVEGSQQLITRWG
jgi:DNA-binding SARP family transcriptional activator